MTDLERIKSRVVAATKVAEAKVGIADIIVELNHDGDGYEFFRVIIEVRHGERAGHADYLAWLESVEDAVGEIDPRYPSVRFSDAA